jgi:4-diphosphocytidyl-2-C-methyl-D-erythritol kinase
MTLLTESARAKVNLTLRVLGRRADGYHDIESLVAFADCADTLTLEPGRELGLSVTGPRAAECGEAGDNLVLRAARLLGEQVPRLALGHFTLDKHLPVAAGIGGGSADAAAALRLLAKANGLSVDDPRLGEAARLTGADVPVCLPSRPCTMTGVGENLAMLNLPPLPCVLVNPRVAVATADVFAALGLRKGELLAGIGDVVLARAWPADDTSFDAWLAAITSRANDLEPPALKVAPVVGEVLAALRATEGARLARMSGSGATCFALFETIGDAGLAAGVLARAHPDWWVHAGVLN